MQKTRIIALHCFNIGSGVGFSDSEEDQGLCGV